MGGKDEDGGVTDSEASSADHQGRGNTCLTLHSPQDSAPEAKEKRRETRQKSVSHESDTRKMPLYLQTTELKVSGSPWLPGCIAASPAKGQLLDGLETSPKGRHRGWGGCDRTSCAEAVHSHCPRCCLRRCGKISRFLTIL